MTTRAFLIALGVTALVLCFSFAMAYYSTPERMTSDGTVTCDGQVMSSGDTCTQTLPDQYKLITITHTYDGQAQYQAALRSQALIYAAIAWLTGIVGGISLIWGLRMERSEAV